MTTPNCRVLIFSILRFISTKCCKTQTLNGEIFHYRDRYGLEADIVLHMEDGRYALIECKLGSAEI